MFALPEVVLWAPVTSKTVRGRLFGGYVTRCGRRLASAKTRTETVVHPTPGNPEEEPGLGVTGRPFSEMPGPKGYPIIGNLLDFPKWVGKGHLMFEDRFRKYGPTYRETLGTMTLVYTKDVDLIEKFVRHEGSIPHRIAIAPWLYWRKDNGRAKGLLIAEGPEWKKMRGYISKHMLKPAHVATFTDNFNEVVTDFIEHLVHIRDTEGDGRRVPGLGTEFFHWSLETIGTVLYEIRFDGLNAQRDPQMSRFIKAVAQIFQATEVLVYFPQPIARIFLPRLYKMHDEAWRTIFTTGQSLIDAKVRSMASALERGESTEGLLGWLVSRPDVSREEIYANVSELMIGAVDTSSNTMQWLLYELARHPEVQETLHREVMAATGAAIPDHSSLQAMPYLKAVVKEILRLYPVGGTAARILQEDMELGGYNIPKDTPLIMVAYWTARNPDLFPDPLTFNPDRWLRDPDDKMKKHNFGWLPFGAGPRMCVGRRVAELEMHLLTARISQRFQLLPGDDEPVEVVSRALFVPSRSVNIQFIDRE